MLDSMSFEDVKPLETNSPKLENHDEPEISSKFKSNREALFVNLDLITTDCLSPVSTVEALPYFLPKTLPVKSSSTSDLPPQSDTQASLCLPPNPAQPIVPSNTDPDPAVEALLYLLKNPTLPAKLSNTGDLLPESDIEALPYLLKNHTQPSNTDPESPCAPQKSPDLDVPTLSIPPKACYPAILAKLSSHASPALPPKPQAPTVPPRSPPRQDYQSRPDFRSLPAVPYSPNQFPTRNITEFKFSSPEHIYWEIKPRSPHSLPNTAQSKVDFKNRPLPSLPGYPPVGYRPLRRDLSAIPTDRSQRDLLAVPIFELPPNGHRSHKHAAPQIPKPSILAAPDLPPKPVKLDSLAVPDSPILPDLHPKTANDTLASKPDIADLVDAPVIPPKP